MEYHHEIAMRSASLGGCLLILTAWQLVAQTTQGIITGRVFDRQSNAGIAGATVTYANLDTNDSGSVRSSSQGTYGIPFLPPGRYRMTAQAPDFQSRILPRLELEVAGRVELNFPLRSNAELRRTGAFSAGSVSLTGQREVVNFFGPDVGFAAPLQVLEPESGTLQPSPSYVIGSDEIDGLPLRGRDPYTLLLTVPGATSDTATARSLGLSIDGQRPSSSDFLLDGVENNDTLNTGTRIQVSPEVVESYRISTNNFSAEFGVASGFVANAVTRAGSNTFHGSVYAYLGNDILNANAFQDNYLGNSRRADRELYAGFWAGGPVRKDRLWFSTAFERYGDQGDNDPQTYALPGAEAMAFTAPNSDAAQLLERFLSPGSGVNAIASNITLSPPTPINQILLLERMDYRSASGSDRLTGRLAVSRQSQPDFTFSPYPDFTSGASVNSSGVAIEYLHTLGPGLANDFRFGWSDDNQRLNRAHPEIPTLQSSDGTVLPSSPLLRASLDHDSTWEFSNSLVWIRGRHIVTAGGGYELNLPSSTNSFGQDGYFVFPSVIQFLQDSPSQLGIATSRQDLPQLTLPDLNRSYRSNEFFGFVQDNLKLTSRIGVSVGLRYDSFGTYKNTGIQDPSFEPGPGASIEQRISDASIVYNSNSENSVYRPDRGNWSGRLGASYDLRGNGSTVLRAGFGIYYDRPFELLIQGVEFNGVDFRYAGVPPNVDFLHFSGLIAPPGSGGPPPTFTSGFPDFTWIDSNLRTPHVQSWFGGVQQQLRKNLTLEISHTGAFGRKLVDSDLVNRPFSVQLTPENTSGLLNPNLPPDIVYRSNSGSSDYLALNSVLRYRSGRAVYQVAYTYSHSIDNQSDPLLGQFQGLTAQSSTTAGLAAFTEQFNSRIDRANSDFDQRHNFVFYFLYNLPGPNGNGILKKALRGWNVSQLGAFRSGFPFTVIAGGGNNALINNRADYLGGDVYESKAVTGGQQFLNPAVFAQPAPGALGNLGRNSLIGPGFYSIDASLSKSFSVPKLGESGRVVVRADAFNFLNHTNLANPNPILLDTTFGVSEYGRSTRPTDSLLATSADETPRQIRLELKLVF